MTIIDCIGEMTIIDLIGFVGGFALGASIVSLGIASVVWLIQKM